MKNLKILKRRIEIEMLKAFLIMLVIFVVFSSLGMMTIVVPVLIYRGIRKIRKRLKGQKVKSL